MVIFFLHNDGPLSDNSTDKSFVTAKHIVFLDAFVLYLGESHRYQHTVSFGAVIPPEKIVTKMCQNLDYFGRP